MLISLLDEVKKITVKLSRAPPIAFANSKKLINDSYNNNLEKHLDFKAENLKISAGTEVFKEG